MSSYFVNRLTNCYTQEGDGGGGESAREAYPQTSSPYHRNYNSGVNTASYPAYGSPSPGAATGHNGTEYYHGMNTQRLSYPPILREKHSPPSHPSGYGGSGQCYRSYKSKKSTKQVSRLPTSNFEYQYSQQ